MPYISLVGVRVVVRVVAHLAKGIFFACRETLILAIAVP